MRYNPFHLCEYDRNGTWDNRENDLLITLYKADTEKFDGISHDDLYRKIVAMNIGSIKKGITQQKYKDSDTPNGNLFFVLTDVNKERDLDNIPQSFDFLINNNPVRMWLNFRGKKLSLIHI